MPTSTATTAMITTWHSAPLARGGLATQPNGILATRGGHVNHSERIRGSRQAVTELLQTVLRVSSATSASLSRLPTAFVKTAKSLMRIATSALGKTTSSVTIVWMATGLIQPQVNVCSAMEIILNNVNLMRTCIKP